MHFLQSHRFGFFVCGLTFGFLTTSKAWAADYLHDVKPILKMHCYRCHAGDQPKSNFSLDTAAGLIAGGKNGKAIVPGEVSESPLIDILHGNHAQIPQMPFREKALSKSQIKMLAAWIEAGAPFPKNEIADPHIHWAFAPIVRPEIPASSGFAESNPIDRFIANRLTQKGLKASPRAKPEVLLRRLHLDITGIVPTIEEIEDYLKDDSENAMERRVDALLASPRFGERWGRHWLDLARYADSNGYSIDSPRSIWRYRDYVIDAFNQNLPFDQFVIEQLAGDLLPNPSDAQRIATGFHRNTQINQEGGIDKEQFRIEAIVDRVATTGTAFLGLTIACAQCHDHKFDPISQSEYYEFFAFFNNQDEPEMATPLPEELAALARFEDALSRQKLKIEKSESRIHKRILADEKSFSKSEFAALPKALQIILTKPSSSRTSEEVKKLFKYFLESSASHKALVEELSAIQKRKPRISTTMILREKAKLRPTFIHIKGDFTRRGNEVSPSTPKVLGLLKTQSRANRLDLAHWLVRADNPLLARVFVNRIWQQYFGRGIVETENDFGTQGTPPSHPALLDWLAIELIESDWNVKALHKKILMSSTYQQSSIANSHQLRIDPDNHFFARQSRMRLEAEIIRDVALSVAGVLSDKMGGPSVHPPQPSGVMKLGQVQRSWRADRGEDRFRRGVYTFFWRATPHPALIVFDSPDALSACGRRIVSNTPLQALTLLNDPAFFELAIAFAKRIQNLSCAEDRERIRDAFRLCLARFPTAEETQKLHNALQGIESAQSQLPKSSSQSSSKDLSFEESSLGELRVDSRWLVLARILLNLDETITRE